MLSDVSQIVTRSWIDRKVKAVCKANLSTAGFLEIGDTLIDGRDVVVRSRDMTGNVDDFVTFDNRSHVRWYTRFKPLIYFTCYATQLFPMLRLSLESICEFGCYAGDILIITDKEEKQVLSYVPEELKQRVEVWNYPAIDILDITCARYQIALWSKASQYQPLLYMDTDVIVDAPLQEVLLQITSQSRMCFQGESSHQLSVDVGVGSLRFQDAGIDVKGKTGYNSGIMGLPSLSSISADLLCIVEGTYRYAVARGTRNLEWCDQATGNYIMYMLGGTEQDILFRSVRWGSRNALHGGMKPKGFVHLWGTKVKEQEMRDLLTMLRGHARLDHEPWIVYDNGTRSDLTYMGRNLGTSYEE